MLIKKSHRVLLLIALSCLTVLSALFAVVYGATNIPFSTTLKALQTLVFPSLNPMIPQDQVNTQIVLDIRLPRILLAGTVGAGLAICGLITQSLLRNPLGDPYILGISSGASTGAALVIVLGTSNALLASIGLTMGAFIGAFAAIGLVSVLALAGGRMTPTRIIFAGMAVNYLFSALTSLITLMAKNAAGTKSVMFWMLGSLSAASWRDVTIGATVSAIAGATFFFLGRRVDILNLGDDTALALGTNPRIYRSILFIFIALTVATLVSLTGAIGFIGLVIPHLAKLLVGSTTRMALPVATISGALLVILADLGARLVIRPAELPIGILTAIVGTPMLMALIKKYSN